MEVRFFEEADQEVDNAFCWYESQVTGLGYAFLKVMDDAITVIKAFPYGFPSARGELKKCLLRRFPYSLIYGIDNDVIIVVAVAHAKKRPGYWMSRVKE